MPWSNRKTSMDEWIFVALLHNLPVKTPVGNDHISIAPPADPRVEALRSRSPTFCKFIASFTDQFQRPTQPSLLLLRKNIPPRPEGVFAFRNALAISSITRAWERYLGYGGQSEYLKFSNYFDFYPYTLTQDEQYLSLHTASVWGGDTVKQFHGQYSPELARASLKEKETFFDTTLFAALLDKWVEHYVEKKRGWSTRALFRSLGMAYRASALPQLDLYDLGANLALWVSAFEILVHPGKGRTGLKEVLALLEKAVFLYITKLGHRSYTIAVNKKEQNATLAQKTYYEMYSARNDFLHGNSVRDSKLFPAGNLQSRPLTMGAVLIYKCALMTFLEIFERLRPVSIDEPVSPENEKIIEKIFYQRDFEMALRNLRQSKRKR